MFNYDQSLPGLDHQLCKGPDPMGTTRDCSKVNNNNNNNNNNSKWQEQGVQTEQQIASSSSSKSSSANSNSNSNSTSTSTSASSSSSRANPETGSNISTWPLLPATQTANEQAKQQQQNQRNGCILLLNSLPQVVNNSALVRQRASAKDSLAAASLNAGASVPLMAGSGCNLGGRLAASKCHLSDCPHARLVNASSESIARPHVLLANSFDRTPAVAAAQTPVQPSPQPLLPASKTVVPKNTALRAEHRKQNMVSVVRPVVSTANSNHNHNHHPEQQRPLDLIGGNGDPMGGRAMRVRPEESLNQKHYKQNICCSILEDFMMLDRQITHTQQQLSPDLFSNTCDRFQKLDQLSSGHLHTYSGQNNNENDNYNNLISIGRSLYDQQEKLQLGDQFGEQQARQQAALFRREEFDLNRAIRKQHRFLLTKLGERKRGLQIIQAVWFQKGFKEAIERLVDIYHQGLIFTSSATGAAGSDPVGDPDDHLFDHQLSRNKLIKGHQHQRGATLNSLNTSLVVDVLGIIILRPKLWNLEICQLLLPIINNDLMIQTKPGYENYLEVALKAINLILTHFSGVIITTLGSHRKEVGGGPTTKTLVGVDLSSEDRLNKCLNCCKLLLESRSIIRMARQHRTPSSNPATGGDRSSFNLISRELEQLFVTFESSIEPSQIGLLSSSNNNRR